MKHPIKAGALLASVACVSLAMSACGSSGAGSGADKNTLTMQVEQGEPNLSIAQAFVKGFQKTHPKVKVTFQQIGPDAVKSTNLTALSSSRPPDIGLIATDTPAYGQLLKGGALADLRSVWKDADLNKRYPAALNKLLEHNNTHYSIGIATGFYDIIFYNKKLFENSSITVPADHRITDPAQLYAMVDKLKKGGVDGIAVGAKSAYPASWMVDNLLPTAVTPDQMDNYLKNFQPSEPVTAKYTDSGFINTLTQLADFKSHNVYQAGFLGADLAGAEASFAQGQAGMLQDGYWAIPALRKAAPSRDLGWLLLPPVEGSTTKAGLASFFSTGYSVPSKGDNQELAKKFLEYMVSDEGQTDAVLKAGSELPCVTTVAPSAYSSLDPLANEMVADAKKNGQVLGWTSYVPASVGQAFTDPLIQQMYAGQITPKEIGAKVQAALDQTRGTNK